MNARRKWTRDELLLAINLYCQIPFGRIHSRNPQIIELAKILNRAPGAVSWKLVNFAHIDPSLNRTGASHVSKLDREVWAEFFNDWDSLVFQSECLFHDSRKNLQGVSEYDKFPDKTGKDIERKVRVRINQDFFRRMILSSYNERCCLTGLSIPELLVASHIKPWAIDEKNRTNPQNGLCLNALHDKAFDRGLISLSNDYHIIVSKKVKKINNEPEKQLLLNFEDKKITLPKRFLPNKKFLAFHRNNIFSD
jgi:putative restriction endonuclease